MSRALINTSTLAFAFLLSLFASFVAPSTSSAAGQDAFPPVRETCKDVRGPELLTPAHAQRQCPQYCKKSGREWNGQYRNFDQRIGGDGVCGCCTSSVPVSTVKATLNRGRTQESTSKKLTVKPVACTAAILALHVSIAKAATSCAAAIAEEGVNPLADAYCASATATVAFNTKKVIDACRTSAVIVHKARKAPAARLAKRKAPKARAAHAAKRKAPKAGASRGAKGKAPKAARRVVKSKPGNKSKPGKSKPRKRKS